MKTRQLQRGPLAKAAAGRSGPPHLAGSPARPKRRPETAQERWSCGTAGRGLAACCRTSTAPRLPRCVCVCVYVCMCRCVCLCVYVCMCMCVRARVCVDGLRCRGRRQAPPEGACKFTRLGKEREAPPGATVPPPPRRHATYRPDHEAQISQECGDQVPGDGELDDRLDGELDQQDHPLVLLRFGDLYISVSIYLSLSCTSLSLSLPLYIYSSSV